MIWTVDCTDEFVAWWRTLGADEQDAVVAAVERLERWGPGLGRPLPDAFEFLPPTGNTRVSFSVDPQRSAITLRAGVAFDWEAEADESWYDAMMPIADRLLVAYLAPFSPGGPAAVTMGPTEPRFADLAVAARADPERRRRIAAYGRTIDDPLALAVVRACRGQPEQAVARTLRAIQDRAAPGAAGDPFAAAYGAYLETIRARAALELLARERENGHAP